MFNKMKRFMAILLSLTMLLSAMPMNALAETFSSGWTSAVDDGVSLLAEGNYTVRVGQTITIEGSSGYSHYWYVDDDAQNTGSVILTNTGSRTVRVEGVTEGTVTLVHYYRSNGRYRIQTFTVQVTALEASMQYIYLYVQVGGNTDGLTINKDGWYTVGYITHKIPDGDDVHDSYWSEDNRYTYGELYLDGVVAAVSPGAITLYPTNANVFTDEVLNSIDWTYYGLNISGGASDYVSDSTSWEWHLDGHLQIDYKILIEQWVECSEGESGAEFHNGKWYKKHGITGFNAYSDDDFGEVLTAEGLAANRPIDNYEFVGGDPESIELSRKTNNRTVKLYYDKMVGNLTVEKQFGEGYTLAEAESFTLNYAYTVEGDNHSGSIVATWNPDTQSFTYSSNSADVTNGNTLSGLPVGTQVTITEQDASGYDVTYTPNQTVTIAQGTQTVTVTNTVSTGSLTLVKEMGEGSALPSAGESFNLNYSYMEGETEVKGTVVATWNGKTFKYMIGEEAGNTIDGIPVGTTVTISESGADNYKASYSGDVTVSAAGDATAIIDVDGQTVTLTNTRKLGQIGYNLVRQDATINTTGWSFYEYSGTGAPKYTVDNEWYANGDQYEVTDRIPTSDGYIFVGWFDKAFSQAGGVNDPAEILHAGEYNTYNRELTDERVQTLDAIWATLAVENAVYVYDEQAHTIPTPNGGYSLEGLDPEYQDQIESENLVRVSGYEYATSENGTYSTTLPTFTEVGVHEVWVKATVTAGSRSTEIVKCATVTIYPRLVVEKTLAEGEAETDESFTFVLAKGGSPVAGAEYVVLNSEGTTVATKTTGTDGSFTLAAGQTATFTGEGINIASYPGTYTVTEQSKNGWVTPSAQSADLTLAVDDNEIVLVFTNSRSTQQITITKTWDDESDQDGLRPDPSEFSVTLTGNNKTFTVKDAAEGAEEGKWTVSGNVWTATITVPAYTDNGTAITYTVSEGSTQTDTDFDENYTMSGDTTVTPANGDADVAITNTHTTATTSVSVKKVWSDYGNADETRMESVTVALYNGNTQVGDPIVLSQSNDWSGSWTGLPANASGVTINYIVRELNGDTIIDPNGTIPSAVEDENYVVTYTEDEGNAWTVTNTYTATVEVSGTKTWDGLTSGETAPQVTVQLQKWDSDSETWMNVTGVATQQVGNGGTYTFSDLPKYELVGDDYVEVQYRVVETGLKNGVTSAGGDAENEYDLTNMMDTTSVTITKVWNDQDNAYGLRPDSVTVTLTATSGAIPYSYPVVLTEANNWAATITGVRTHDLNGNALTYTVSENVAAPYQSAISPEKITPANVEGEVEVTVTNTLQTMDVVVDKTWDLNGIELATYPAVGLTLYYDGEQVATATLVQDGDGEWTATFADVPYRVSGYTVVETSITGGTFPEDTLNAPDTAAELFTDTNEQTATVGTPTADGEGNYTATASLTNTAKDSDGKDELGAMTVTKVLNLNGTTWATNSDYPTFTFTVEGAYSEDGGNVTLSLTPAANGDQISATSGQILAVVGGSVTVTEAEQAGWTPEGSVYEKAIEEVRDDGTSNVTFTNTRDVVKSLTVTKVWSVPAGMTMPTPALSVEITRSVEGGTGETVVAGIALSESNEWSWTAEGTFPTHDENGNAYIYSATEEAADPAEQSVLAQYDLTVGTAKPAEGGTKIVLTNAISDEDTVTVTVQKSVVDESGTTPNDKTFAISYTVNSNGTQIASGTLELANNGSQAIIVPKGATVTVSETPGDEWTVSYSNNGQVFDENGTITVTNTRRVMDITVTKTWQDRNGAETDRPTVTFELYYGDGTTKVEDSSGNQVTAALDTATNTATFSNLPYSENGYVVKEVMANNDAGYESSWTNGQSVTFDEDGATLSVTNTRTKAKVTVTKQIVDDTTDSAAGLASEFIFQVKDGDVEVVRTKPVGNGESVTIYLEIGKTYTVAELDANGNALNEDIWTPSGSGTNCAFTGDSFIVRDTDNPSDVTVTVTNTRKSTSVGVTKVWVDNGNADGTRPDTIEVKLQSSVSGGAWVDVQDAIETLDVTQTGNSDTYEDVFANLPAYTLSGDAVSYCVIETSASIVGGNDATYTPSVDGSTITNKLDAGETSFTFTKKWVDGGERQIATEDLFALYRRSSGGWELVDAAPSIANGDTDTWTITYSDLAKYDGSGVAYTYAVVETLPQSDYVQSISDEVEVTVDGQAATGVANGGTITNKLEGTVDIAVTKVWADGDGALDANLIPEEVTVEIYRSDNAAQPYATRTLNDGNDWAATVEGAPKYDGEGNLYDYSVAEAGAENGKIAIDGKVYSVEISEEPANGFTVTNTRDSEEPQAPVKTATAINGTAITTTDGVEVEVGDTITYQIAYRNYTNQRQTLTITDALDDGVDYVGATGDPTEGNVSAVYDEDAHTVTWTIENVDPFTDGSVTLTVRVNETAKEVGTDEMVATVDNAASLTIGKTTTTSETVIIPVKDDEPTDPTKEAAEINDVVIETTDGVTVEVGDEITYEIAYTNHTADRVDVTIADELDGGVDYVSATDGGQYDPNAHTVTWTIEGVAPFTSGSVTLTVKVNETAKEVGDDEDLATVDNTATVTIGNNSSETTTPVEIPVKDDEPADPTKEATQINDTVIETTDGVTVEVGDAITYEIAYTNHTADRVDVTIRDVLDGGVDYVGATGDPTEGNVTAVYDEETHTVTWTIKDVAPFTDGSVMLTVEVNEDAKKTEPGEELATVDNTAYVSIGDNAEVESNPVEIPVKPDDPENPEKSSDIEDSGNSFGMIEVGDQIVYTIEYYNNLNVPANVTITDVLDGGVDFVSAGNGGSYDSAAHTVTWTIQNVAPFTTGTVTLTVVVNESAIDGSDPTVTNTASAQVGNQSSFDSEPVEIPVYNPDVEIVKEVVDNREESEQKGYYTVGETVEFEITVTNTGNVTLSNLVVSDDIHASGDAEIVAGAGYQIDAGGNAVIAALEPGESVVVHAQYAVQVGDLGDEPVVNTASVTAPDPDDPDKPPVEDEDEAEFTPDVTTEVIGSKIWNDLENLYNTRPDSITVRLYADGAEYAVQTVTAGSGWTFAFTGLPAHNADGTEIRYTVTEDAVTGYDATLIPAGGDENASCEWEIQNDLQQYTLTVRYWYDEVGGRTAAPTVTGTYYYGQSYSVTSPSIPGYTSNPSVVSGVITGDVVRDVIYTAIDYTLTIYYVYEDGTTAALTYTEVLNVNDDYYVVSPVLEGYVASRRVVSGTMPANNVVYTVIYVPETETVEIDRDGVSLNIGSVVMNAGDCFE